jgi:hypothetical protein
MIVVSHSKRLLEPQLEEIKGSNIHAIMIMNRVDIAFDVEDVGRTLARYSCQKAEEHLRENCRNYYFYAGHATHSQCHVYFLSKKDMDEFIVWSKVALPISLDDARRRSKAEWDKKSDLWKFDGEWEDPFA